MAVCEQTIPPPELAGGVSVPQLQPGGSLSVQTHETDMKDRFENTHLGWSSTAALCQSQLTLLGLGKATYEIIGVTMRKGLVTC